MAVYSFSSYTGLASKANATGTTINCATSPSGQVSAVPVDDWRDLTALALVLAGASFWHLRHP